MDFFYDDKSLAIELFNETLLVVISYHFLLFYHIVTDKLGKDILGTSLVVLTFILLGFNILLIAGDGLA